MEIPIWDGEWWRCIPFTIFERGLFEVGPTGENLPASFICIPSWLFFGAVFIILIVIILGANDEGRGASSGGKSG